MYFSAYAYSRFNVLIQNQPKHTHETKPQRGCRSTHMKKPVPIPIPNPIPMVPGLGPALFVWSHKKSQNLSRISLELFLWAQPCSTWGNLITCPTRFENCNAVRINETHLLLPRFAGDWRVIKGFGRPWLKTSKLHTEILNWQHISWRGSGFLNGERERRGQKIRATVSEQGHLKVPHYVGHTSPAGSRSWAELVPHWLSIESPIADVLIYFPGKGQEGYMPSFWSSACAPAFSRFFPHWACL